MVVLNGDKGRLMCCTCEGIEGLGWAILESDPKVSAPHKGGCGVADSECMACTQRAVCAEDSVAGSNSEKVVCAGCGEVGSERMVCAEGSVAGGEGTVCAEGSIITGSDSVESALTVQLSEISRISRNSAMRRDSRRESFGALHQLGCLPT